ncbi:hypothetical protein [Nocardia inohanensis]|uniref:hypothetical protein n=1 Tax=Nocardia inohanensis TaxID=209246 RepID=UPI00082C157B|nr:hypothetical protein [Nocardia inohanensis]
MPHDLPPAPEPVALSLSMPPAPARGLTQDLVRPIAATPGTEVLDLTAGDEAISEFLVRIAHADTGFVARTDSGDRAIAIVAATVAALCGEDIRAALTAPDIAFLKGLKPPAVEAFRSVLLAIESDDPAVATALTALA